MRRLIKKYLCFLMLFSLTVVLATPSASAATKYDKMYVHYIDVGESDCILIISDSRSMLIDAGDIGDEDIIINYLRKQGVKKLDYIIATHPHADHIGSMDDVIQEFSVGKVLMPKVVHTTDAFDALLSAIEDKGLKITRPVVGTEYKIGKASFTMIAPNSTDYEELNNHSIGIRLTNGKNSFVFIGDAEKEAISDILKNDIDINADVLLCGHHGSDTSTTSELLEAVTPKDAVISVGKNSYGHPSEGVVGLLKDYKIDTYRTDENGTIIATSTGTKITFNAVTYQYQESDKDETNSSKTIVYITETGTKYHRDNCAYLKKSKIKTTLKEAKAKDLSPCSKCKPPE